MKNSEDTTSYEVSIKLLLVGSGRYLDAGSQLRACLIFRLDFQSQEGNRSPGFYSSIYRIAGVFEGPNFHGRAIFKDFAI